MKKSLVRTSKFLSLVLRHKPESIGLELDTEGWANVADLLRCSGVISNTGFSFISEALHVGRKILTKPLTHQTEQESNALALEKLGLATVVRRITTEAVRSWTELPSPPASNYPDVLPAIADWIDQAEWGTAESLASNLWARTATGSG